MGDGPRSTDVTITTLIDNAHGEPGLRSQWGLSFWVETAAGRVLFDCGSSDAFLRNARWLGVEVGTTDVFVLSHGHFDHGGGIRWAAEQAPQVPLVMHPGAVVPRYWLCKTGKLDPIGLPERSLTMLWGRPERIVWAEGPVQVTPGVWASGPVPRRHPLEEAERNFFFDKACTVRDHVVDDQVLWVETPKGLVVLCGCAHAGVINAVECVRAAAAERDEEAGAERSQTRLAGKGKPVSDGEPVAVLPRFRLPEAADGQPKVRAVLGGFHLLQARKDRLEATADYLESLELELCAPCHCTGKRATKLLRERLGDAFVEVGSGRRMRLA